MGLFLSICQQMPINKYFIRIFFENICFEPENSPWVASLAFSSRERDLNINWRRHATLSAFCFRFFAYFFVSCFYLSAGMFVSSFSDFFFYWRLDSRVSQVQWARPGQVRAGRLALVFNQVVAYKFQLSATNVWLALLSRPSRWLIKAVGLAPLIGFIFESEIFLLFVGWWLWQWILEWKSSWHSKNSKQVGKLLASSRMATLIASF